MAAKKQSAAKAKGPPVKPVAPKQLQKQTTKIIVGRQTRRGSIATSTEDEDSPVSSALPLAVTPKKKAKKEAAEPPTSPARNPASESTKSSGSSSSRRSPGISESSVSGRKGKASSSGVNNKNNNNSSSSSSSSNSSSSSSKPPQTPLSEFKLLSDDLSPSTFGPSLGAMAGIAGMSGSRHYVGGTGAVGYPSFGSAASPLIPYSASSSKTAMVPSSREWFTGSSSSNSSSEGEWSNSIPDFAFSANNSPSGHNSSSNGSSSSSSSSSSGAGDIATRRAKDTLEAPNFGGLFMEPPFASHQKRRHHDFPEDDSYPEDGDDDDDEDYDGHSVSHSNSRSSRRTYNGSRSSSGGLSSKRRRKKRVPGSDEFEDAGDSPHHGSSLHAVTPEAGETRPRCNCKRTKCLKLYCDCLRTNKFCEGCNCYECANTEKNSVERSLAIKNIIDRNPTAFRARISEDPMSLSKEHLQGCHCKKSQCLKKYCECYAATAACTERCKCLNCSNGGNGQEEEPSPRGVLQGRSRAKARVERDVEAEAEDTFSVSLDEEDEGEGGRTGKSLSVLKRNARRRRA